MTRLRSVAAGHPRHSIALALAAGLALCQLPAVLLFALAAALVIVLTALGSRAHVALAACALLIVGSAIGAQRLRAIDADPLATAASGVIVLHGELVNLPRNGEHGGSLRIRALPAGQLVQVRTRQAISRSISIGDELELNGRLRAVEPQRANGPEAKNYARYLLRSGVRRQFDAIEVIATGHSRGGPLGVVDAIRRRSERALAFGLEPEPAALLRGMVLGGDAALPEATAEDFRVAGLSHILAVSGQNVLLIVILVLAILTALGAPRRARLNVPAVVIVVYVLLCGAQASVIRAGAMGLAALAALAASRPASRIYALILASIVVLAWNPRACADVGAQLSFAAVLGIMAFTGPIAQRLHGLPRPLAEAFAATAAATIATAPLMAFHFEAVSIISLAANVLGEPLIAPIVWLGSLTAALGQLSTSIAALLGAPNSFLLGALITLANVAAKVPGAQLQWQAFGTLELIAAFAAIVIAGAAVHGWITLPITRARLCVCALLLAALLLPVGGSQGSRIRGPAIAMLDVGQGDATLLIGHGCAALIDGGPPGDQLGEKLRRAGVDRLDALLITHPEDDHFGGALELAREGDVRVGTLIDGGGNTPRADYQELRSRLRARGTKAIDAVDGASWSCPGVAIEVIGPAPQAPTAPPPAEPNERAAVTRIDVGGLSMFASGDAESPQLLGLPLGGTDILKVAHHGSADPGLFALIERLRPRVALIGVGKRNRYGHPVPATTSALEASGARVLRTDRDGTIVLRPGVNGSIAVAVRGGQQ